MGKEKEMATMKAQKEVKPLRGKERIQQLVEAFPEIPRRQVVLKDLSSQGLRSNETTRRLGRWALPDAPAWFEYNKEEAHKAADRTEAYYLNPVAAYFADGAGFGIQFDSRSPYDIRYEERGRYWLYRDGEAIEEVFFTPRPQWYDRKTSCGKPMPSCVSQSSEGALKIAAWNHCEYAKDKLTCRFCNLNAAEATDKNMGLVRQTFKREQDVYETMLAACLEREQRSLTVTGGSILNLSKEADMYARLIKASRQAEKDAGYQAPMPILMKTQAMEPEDAAKLKEAGVTTLGFNTEVWDPRLFEWLCPGKAKYVGRERWLERLVKAVGVFGEGNMVSSFILGVEMAPPYGFKTEDEAAASYLEGWKWMLDHGIGPQTPDWRPVPGTEFAGLPSPRTEYLLRVSLARQKLSAQYDKKLTANTSF